MAWRVIISGTGPMPSIVTEADTVVTPPPPPPPPPPLPPPVEDTSPFLWPPQPGAVYYSDERWSGIGQEFYASQPHYRNPSPGSHRYAGRIVAGRAPWGENLAGHALWAPLTAAKASILRALATGQP